MIAENDGELSLTISGDGSALSGMRLFDEICAAVCEYTGGRRAKVVAAAAEALIFGASESLTGFSIYVDSNAVSGALIMYVKRAEPVPDGDAFPDVDALLTDTYADLNALCDACALLMPAGHNISYNIDEMSGNVLLSVYGDGEDAWPLCAALMRLCWLGAERNGLIINRLSIGFYDRDMTALLSVGIGAADAYAYPEITAGEADALRAKLMELTVESDVLVIGDDG